MKDIFILGAFSGKNVGDEAILESTLINLSNTWGNETRFLIPTRDPKNLDRYKQKYDILTTDVSLHFNIFKLFCDG